MRIARGLDVEPIGDGGVRVRSSDWPWARWCAAAALAPGLALVLWSTATRHWIELGGGAVFCAFGVAALAASMKRRVLDVSARRDGVAISGARGAWPLARGVAENLVGPVRVEIRPFAVPAGAPDLPDRGGDLVLVADATEVRLARRVGPGWRAALETARDLVVAGIPAAGLLHSRP